MAGLTPGALPHRITIQRNQPTNSIRGQQVDSWEDFVANVPARIEASSARAGTASSREMYAQQQVNAEITMQATLRWLRGVDHAMRVVHGSDVYEIVGPPVNVELRNRVLKLNLRMII